MKTLVVQMEVTWEVPDDWELEVVPDGDDEWHLLKVDGQRLFPAVNSVKWETPLFDAKGECTGEEPATAFEKKYAKVFEDGLASASIGIALEPLADEE